MVNLTYLCGNILYNELTVISLLNQIQIATLLSLTASVHLLLTSQLVVVVILRFLPLDHFPYKYIPMVLEPLLLTLQYNHYLHQYWPDKCLVHQPLHHYLVLLHWRQLQNYLLSHLPSSSLVALQEVILVNLLMCWIPQIFFHPTCILTLLTIRRHHITFLQFKFTIIL